MQHTFAPHGHVLTNAGVWSPDSQWIVYDVRSRADGRDFDGARIERVHVETGEVQVLYTSPTDAFCGVATCSPVDDRVVFIHGPEAPEEQWQYAAYHRRGVVVRANAPGAALTLDACNLTPPFIPGALRGGSHVHTFSGDGQWVAFTYEDHLLAQLPQHDAGPSAGHDWNQRNVGVSVPLGPVIPSTRHPRNHAGSHFSVLATQTVNRPTPGSDEISKAYEEAWIGTQGYLQASRRRQLRALAFQGQVVTATGQTISEVFVVDLPDDVTQPGPAGPLGGTERRRPAPPRGTIQRRLTFTADRRYPGVCQEVRHWLRSSPDGSQIACLLRDEQAIVQLWLVSPASGELRQLTRNPVDVSSAFTWSPDGRHLAHVMDGSVCLTDAQSGQTTRLITTQTPGPAAQACVFSPDGRRIAYMQQDRDSPWVQIHSLLAGK